MSVDNLKKTDFFPELENFTHRKILNSLEHLWEVFGKIDGYILESLSQSPAQNREKAEIPQGLELQEKTGGERMLFCTSPLELSEDFISLSLNICIGARTKIEPSAVIKGPSLIGGGCEIRQGAYLRGNVIAGEGCTLGHATEIKNSILMDHTEAGHFNYIGDSLIGSYVNIGAGTKLANLKFRSAEDKKAGVFPEIIFKCEGERIYTGISKFGAIVGDYCETGCNSVISPAVMLGVGCMVYPNVTVPSGCYPPGKLVRPKR